MSIYQAREEIKLPTVLILLTIFGLGLSYFIYFKQFVIPQIPYEFQRFHDITFVYLWCIIMGIVFLWYFQFSISIELTHENLILIYEKKGNEVKKEILPRSSVSLDVDITYSTTSRSSGPAYFLKISLTDGKKLSVNMKSYTAIEKFVSEWNQFGYTFVSLKTFEEYKKEWNKAQGRTVFLVIVMFILFFIFLYQFRAK